MFKKLLSVVGIAAAITLGSAAAASAVYTPGVEIVAGDVTLAPGESTVITVNGLGERDTVNFAYTGPGGSLASIVAASAGGTSVDKPVNGGSASATFTANAVGDHVIVVSDETGVLESITITVAAAGTGTGGTGGNAGGQLPATGGTVPAAAIWAGVGAIGLGGIAVAAVAARRRRAAKN